MVPYLSQLSEWYILRLALILRLSISQFRLASGLEPLTELLKSNDDEVRRSASWAVTVICVDEPTAIELSKLGCLEILQEIQMSGTRANRFTDAAMDKMLDCNLSAKYALSGFLGKSW